MISPKVNDSNFKIFVCLFFGCGPFLKFFFLIEFIITLFLFYTLVFDCEACGILVLQPRVEHALPVLEGEVSAT